ncbi:hypothetical protein YTPLAS18_29810 [Nitrospira sp.]|nr:hypothetical protein YTPLAS18_29810 [Nitrospira sp.]
MTWLLVASLWMVLPGCLSLPREGTGPVRTFLWSAPQDRQTQSVSASDAAKAPIGVIIVAQPQAQPGFDSPRMTYMKRPYELQYFSSNEWVDQPTRMLAPLLVRAIEQQGVARAVVGLPSSARGDLRLDVDGVEAVQEFFDVPSHARIAFRARLVRLSDHAVLGSHAFEAIEPAPTEDAYGGAMAANRAVAKAVDEMADWVARCIRNPASGCK